MNDIVIPYLPNKSGELNVCIDLIEKNVPHNKIYVIEDRYSGISHIDQILKLKQAIENNNLTNDIYLFNDDFFVLRPIKNIPYYHKGYLKDQFARTVWKPYKKAIENTMAIFPDGLSYELHIPMLFNTEKLYKLIVDFIEPAIKNHQCPLIRSSYGNYYNVGGGFMHDVKNINNFAGYTFLSTDERTFRRDLGNYIKAMV